MIDLAFIAANFGLPGLGSFVGSVIAAWVTCPNRGCCKSKLIKEVVERG